MNKKILLTILLTSVLAGCGNKINNRETQELSIVAPTGAPAVAFYNYAGKENFETNGVPSNIVALMNSVNGKDAVVIDTTSGLKAINNKADYKIAATITFGNFYIAATGKDEDNVMDENDTIVLFGQNQTPDLMFHHIYGNKFDNKIEWVGNAQDAAKCLLKGVNDVTQSTIDYVFIAEPALYTVLNNQNAPTYGKASVYANVQELYKEKNNGLEMIQASLFIKNGLDKSVTDKFLSSLEEDINNGINNPQLIQDKLLANDEDGTLFGVKGNIAKAVTENGNRMGLGFKKAYENKQAIDKYVQLFNLEETNEEIYYK